jgi:osmotically-inducible protein OsmY
MKTIIYLLSVTIVGVVFVSSVFTGCKKVSPTRTVTEEQIDQNLGENVKAAFEASPSFKFPDVQVAAFKEKIQLSGFVISEDQKSSAENITKKVPGVVKVENRIELKH